MQETISGTFIGFGDPNLFGSLPSGAIVEVGPSQALTFGTGGGTIGVSVILDPNAMGSPMPEAGAWAMMLVGFGTVGVSIRSSRRHLKIVTA